MVCQKTFTLDCICETDMKYFFLASFSFIHKSYATPNINILLQNILEDVQVISGLILNKKDEFWKWFTIQAPLEKHEPINKWV